MLNDAQAIVTKAAFSVRLGKQTIDVVERRPCAVKIKFENLVRALRLRVIKEKALQF
jgi:hypothetical protein